MYKACKTPQSAQRQREVVECLVDMMRTQQYGDITVCALCQRAQMPRKAFYRYFETKDDVFEALVELTMLEYERFAGPYREGDRRTSEKDALKLFTFWQGKKPLLDILHANGLCQRFFGRIVSRSCDEKVGSSSILVNDSAFSLRSATYFSVSGIFAVVLDWYAQGYPAAPQEMAQLLQRLLTQPIYRQLT